jgi:DNA-binding response OmpR family regulator
MANQNPSLSPRRETLNVMVISPDPIQYKLLSMALQLEWSCEIFSCEHAQRAEERIQTQAPDLVLLDVLLMEHAALPIVERLRQCSGRSELPVLVLNAEVASQSEHLLCLTRSWKMPDLYDAIRQLLDLPG